MKPSAWKTSTIQEQARMQPWRLPEAAWGQEQRSQGLAALARRFEPISLKEMEAAALLKRIDTKFVMTEGQLLEALAAVQQDYWMLCIQGQRLNHYRTLYFDSPDFELYRRHVNGHADRYKVRSREYTDSCQSFLEVKHKTNKGRTIKERVATAQPVVRLTREAEDWLRGVFPYDSRELEPKIWNTFTRLTLVGKPCCERVTLDIELNFYTAHKVVQLEGIAVAEVKREATGGTSPFLVQMHAQKIHPSGFSKYCMGAALLYEQVKKNTLKPKLLQIGKLNGGAVYYE